MGGNMLQPAPAARRARVAAFRRISLRSSTSLAATLALLLGLSSISFAQGAASITKSITALQKAEKAEKKDTAQAATAPPAAQPLPASPQAIPLPDVAARSQELTQTLQSIEQNLPDRAQLDAMNSAVLERDSVVAGQQADLDSVLKDMPSSLDIREQENYWKGQQAYSGVWRSQLFDWANSAQNAVQQLNLQEPQWAATRAAEADVPGLAPVLDVIDGNLNAIRTLRSQLQDQLRLIVNMQLKVAAQDQVAVEVLGRLAKIRLQLKGRLLDRDSLPLWQIAARRQTGETPGLFHSASSRWIAISAFCSEHRGAIGFLGFLWVVATIVAYRLNRANRDVVPADENQALVLMLLRRWFPLGLLGPLLLAYLLAPYAPTALISIVILISFIPILALLPPLVAPRFALMLYVVVGLYVFNALFSWMSFSAVHKREVQFLTIAIVFFIFAWLLRLPSLRSRKTDARGHRIVILGMRVGLVMVGSALLANLFGYVKLSQFLFLTSIYSAFIAINVFTGVRVFKLLLIVALQSNAAERLAMVRQHRDAILRWMPRILEWSGAVLWFMATVDVLGLRDQVFGWLNDALQFKIAGSSTDVTLGDVLGFFAILVLGYLFSSALRFILREEILSHFHLARGLPELISTTLHYLILVLVFLAAVKAGDVQLNKLTLLTGALGVGVGFGLQNIVNNFVSGLILQFERPIHIGDVLELDGGGAGTVTRIGIRSSTVFTAQGAEIIVPNSNFISNRVTNWTLTEAKRRVDVPIGVAYGTDLKLAMRLLYEAAAIHPDVLTQPLPVAYFKEFGDSSLNFELQFWVMMQSNWIRVRSEVLSSVNQGLDKAGIEIPFPQRDLRLRSIDGTAAEVLAPNGAHALANESTLAENGYGQTATAGGALGKADR
jgi:small-conductance mechanosensitive channel